MVKLRFSKLFFRRKIHNYAEIDIINHNVHFTRITVVEACEKL